MATDVQHSPGDHKDGTPGEADHRAVALVQDIDIHAAFNDLKELVIGVLLLRRCAALGPVDADQPGVERCESTKLQFRFSAAGSNVGVMGAGDSSPD
jgi:hypothetical protein